MLYQSLRSCDLQCVGYLQGKGLSTELITHTKKYTFHLCSSRHNGLMLNKTLKSKLRTTKPFQIIQGWTLTTSSQAIQKIFNIQHTVHVVTGSQYHSFSKLNNSYIYYTFSVLFG
uniref:Uncharacterized protein n=1 Tax=Anguilla anguilla TaxID=7936 RepID=A0A0E9X7L1_ANGAN